MFSNLNQRIVGSPAIYRMNSSVRAQGVRRRHSSRFASLFALLFLTLIFTTGVAQAGTSGPLDLNRATAEQLEALPGIGAVKAAAILAVRDAKGGFQSMDELEAVRGIGPSLAGKLRPLVKIGAKRPTGSKNAKN